MRKNTSFGVKNINSVNCNLQLELRGCVEILLLFGEAWSVAWARWHEFCKLRVTNNVKDLNRLQNYSNHKAICNCYCGLFSDPTERALVKPLLLSPRGIVTDGAANAQEEHAARSNRLNVCTSCFASLKVAQNAKPPQLAIANGFVIGIVL